MVLVNQIARQLAERPVDRKPFVIFCKYCWLFGQTSENFVPRMFLGRFIVADLPSWPCNDLQPFHSNVYIIIQRTVKVRNSFDCIYIGLGFS
jgi:hypothetical protein